MRLALPKTKDLNQGSLFNCVRAPGYYGCRCHGLIITRRCHLTHNKFTILNYVPVVRLQDWVARDLNFFLAKRIIKNLDKQLSDGLRHVPSIDMLIKTFPILDIIEREIPPQQQENLRTLVRYKEIAENALTLGGEFSPDNAILRDYHTRHVKALAEDLVDGKLPDYYYLHTVDATPGSEVGYVALLRHILALPARYAHAIENGMDFSAQSIPMDIQDRLTAEYDPVCLVTGEIQSPFIEHFMQHFTRLWGDIGIEDHEEAIKNRAVRVATGE